MSSSIPESGLSDEELRLLFQSHLKFPENESETTSEKPIDEDLEFESPLEYLIEESDPTDELNLLLQPPFDKFTDAEYIERFERLGGHLTEQQDEYLFSNCFNQLHYFYQKKLFLIRNLTLASEFQPGNTIQDEIDALRKRGAKLTEGQQQFLFTHCLNQIHYFEQEYLFLRKNYDDQVFLDI